MRTQNDQRVPRERTSVLWVVTLCSSCKRQQIEAFIHQPCRRGLRIISLSFQEWGWQGTSAPILGSCHTLTSHTGVTSFPNRYIFRGTLRMLERAQMTSQIWTAKNASGARPVFCLLHSVVRVDVWHRIVVSLGDLVEHTQEVWGCKWGSESTKLIQQTVQGPDVGLGAVWDVLTELGTWASQHIWRPYRSC